MLQAAKRRAPHPVAAVGTMMPEDPPDPSEPDELRRLLDGDAAPGRVRRLQESPATTPPRLAAAPGAALVAMVLPRQQAPLTVALVRDCSSSLRGESPTRHAKRRVVWVNGPSRSRTVMPPSHPQHPGIVAPRSSSADHRSLAAPSGLILAPTTATALTQAYRRCWSWWGVAGWVGCVVGRLRRRWRDHSPFLAARGRCAQLRPIRAVAVAATSKLPYLPTHGRVAGLPASCWSLHRSHRPGQPPPIQPPIRSPILPPS